MCLKNITVFILLLIIFNGKSVCQESVSNTLTAEQWSSDIDSFITGIPGVHINPYHKTSKEEFDKFASGLKSKLPSMTANQILTEFTKMVAMIGDGHTVLNIAGLHNQTSQYSVANFHAYPLEAYIFTEGVFIIFTDEKHKELEGLKLTEINDMKIEKIIEKMKPLVPGDNEYNIKFSLPFFIMTAEYLNGSGLCPDNLKSKFTFEDGSGNKISKTMEPVELSEYFQLLNGKKHPEHAPLYLQNDEKNYWFKYLEDRKVLYINYKRVLIDPEDSLKYFCKRLEEFINTNDIDKTIIDIRNNGGGNNGTCQVFVDLITDNKKINQKGKLFTVIGRQTFSAASYLTTKLEFNTNTIFVGEPTGASPNHYGDNRPLTLPNSGLNIRLSSIYWQNSFPLDDRQWTEPEIKVDIAAEDYFSGKDPVMDAVLNYRHPENISAAFPSEERQALIGKYLFTAFEYMEIKENGEDLMLEVRRPDFIGRDVRYIYTPVYYTSENNYSTGIRDFNISLINTMTKASHRYYEWYTPLADTGYILPGDLFRQGKISEGVTLLKELKSKYPANTNVSESVINNLGYKFLNEKNTEAAIEIFKLNTELYPEAFNTYDSLGEAYLLAGNNTLAVLNYKKSLELNAQNDNARKVLQTLSGK